MSVVAVGVAAVAIVVVILILLWCTSLTLSPPVSPPLAFASIDKALSLLFRCRCFFCVESRRCEDFDADDENGVDIITLPSKSNAFDAPTIFGVSVVV